MARAEKPRGSRRAGSERAQHMMDCTVACTETINPLQACETQGQASLWICIFDPERDDGFRNIDGNGNFPVAPGALVDARGKDQQHRA
jgi:hypothetical protein